MSKIRVTVRDLADDNETHTEIEDDYVIVCAGECHVAHINAHANGTHVLTVKGRRDSRPTKVVQDSEVDDL